MILHERRKRPEAWQIQRGALRHTWLVPLLTLEWVFEWLAYALSRWAFLEVLEYLGSFSVLIAVIFYFSESRGPAEAEALPGLAGHQHRAGQGR